MFGVVVCPRCGRGKGVALKQKTTVCSCGFEIRVTPSKVRGRAATARELVSLVRRANAQAAGGLEAYEKAITPRKAARIQDVHARVIAAVGSNGDRATRVRNAAAELSRELERFTRADWGKVLAGLRIMDAEEALDALLRTNAVFEPKAGFYRAVGLTA